ncbi:class I SAM-dependent methyltransferase [Spongiactinospora sp. TRM90649]|uniref:class I SAM-dependent methyltransferase n=1 Tax=Spongiactinospora sp. TRM90649 TaxID=3031114 RepID=UPI0023F9D476|nr:class I SAM-dependent methyltransferase [Spongiactinospora sp. TRM90649]MDF5751402.1 class I SAM-dependent methyltransferase [Spongiactinospora sp. TRM90649]
MTALPAAPWTLDNIPGRLHETDMRVFDWLLGYQARFFTPGDLVELGADQGKSAIVIGRHRREEERFVVCDRFDQAGLRGGFESNYLAFHQRLPEIVQGPSTVILDHVEPDSCRFAHLAASRAYEDVRDDLAAARKLLVAEGIVVVDDYRFEGAPGIAAAVWEAVTAHGLHPICLTPQKFYGTWGDAGTPQEELTRWLAGHPDEWISHTEPVAGRTVIHLDRAPGAETPQAPGLPEEEEEKEQTLPLPAEPAPVAPRWNTKARHKRRKPLHKRLMRILMPTRLRRRLRRRAK